jgi:hypothetical protein
MKNPAITALLLTALVSPVALFLLLLSHSRLDVPIAAALAVAIGWALNVAWAFAAQGAAARDPSRADGNTVSIATRFGWLCPAVLVLLVWLAWHFVLHR